MTQVTAPQSTGHEEQSSEARKSCGWGCVTGALVVMLMMSLLVLMGYKMADDAGWFRDGGGLVAGGAPGVFTNGQLVKTAFREAPDFTLELYSGEQLRLADLRGKPVMVNFWASWCPPCRQEAPLLERTWREYEEKGVVFIGVNIWDNEDDAQAFLREFDITYPNGPDPRGKISIDYGLTGIPETYFIDREGKIMRKWIGPFTEEALQAFLDEIVASEGGGP